MASESIQEHPPMASDKPSQISEQSPQDQQQQQQSRPEAAPSSSTTNATNSVDTNASSKNEEQQTSSTTITTKASPQKGESLTTKTMNAVNSSDSNPPTKKMEELQQQQPSKVSSPKEASSTTTTTTTTTTNAVNSSDSKSPLTTEEPNAPPQQKKIEEQQQQQPAKDVAETETNQAQPQQQKQGEEKVNAANSPSKQVKEQQEPPLQQTSANSVDIVDRSSVDVVVPPTQQLHKQEDEKVAAKENEAQVEKDPSASDIVKLEEANKSEEPKVENDEVKQKEVKFADGIETKEEKSEIEESSSSREQTTLLSDLKEYERKALLELKSKIEEAVLLNKFFEDDQTIDQTKATDTTNNEQQQPPSQESQDLKKEGEESSAPTSQEDEKITADQAPAVKESKGKEIMIDDQNVSNATADAEPKIGGQKEAEDSSKAEEMMMKKKEMGIIDKEISLWGAPLMPSKGEASTDVILLKFLRAREFRVDEAFEMLKNTLKWRKENNMDSILEEQDPQTDILEPVVYMEGRDREGNPICYNVYGLLGFDKSVDKLLGDEEKRERFLRWRIRKMEQSVKELDFNPGGSCEILQINDLKNTPLPSKKEVRLTTRKVAETLQDNYPEFVSKNIFINVPLWYYAFNTVLSPFLTPRTKNKFIQARTSKVAEILLKYIAAEQLPVRYGGLKMDNDPDFGTEDVAEETWVKAGSSETIEIPALEGGKTMVWDLTVSAWEVSYKEEFVPNNERSYTVIVQKMKKIAWQEGTIRNSFRNGEPGKILLTIDNPSFKKKRILYRHKVKKV
ncbi:unnamed protein product [Linum tenue]|uniref:CRAL-TRIO domain-containing protein n=1 Tax=Linum tenue TaxID=586396 RepID=A0AAV0MUF6_9ROSI|nr:unnamed protein product [Linum tenue]